MSVLSTGSIIGAFEIAALVGKGGMGEVYRARDTRLDREVAIKVMSPELASNPDFLARLQREGKALASLNHSNIAAIHSVEQVDGLHFLVMQLVDGETLGDRLKRERLSIEDAVGIFVQIAQGLDAAHERGIVHRDLKPANIKIAADGTVKLLDFGIAKRVGRASTDPSSPTTPMTSEPLTGEGQILGTPHYMSPEQLRGQPVDKRADIWAFGCCLYETLTGSHAFYGETLADIITSVCRDEPDWELVPEDTPANIRYLLLRCLAKDLSRRLRDIGEAWNILQFERWPVPRTQEAPSNGAVRRVSVPLPAVDPHQFSFAVSPDGETVAYTGILNNRRVLTLRRLSSVEATVVSGTTGAAVPFFSPDGNWLGYFQSDPWRLMRVSLLGGSPQEICGAIAPWGACWLEDGTIVFGGPSSVGLQRVSATGGVPKAVLPQDESANYEYVYPALVPGRPEVIVVFRDPARGRTPNVGVVSLDSAQMFMLVENALRGRVLPSGHLLCQQPSGLTLFPFDIKNRRLTGPPVDVSEPLMPKDMTQPMWYHVTRAGDLFFLPSSAQEEANCELVWVDARGLEERLPLPLQPFRYPSISPDGRELVVSIRAGSGQHTVVIDLERFVSVPVEPVGSLAVFPIWTSDGEAIIHSVREDETWSLQLQPLKSGVGPTQLVKGDALLLAACFWKEENAVVLANQTPGGGAAIGFLSLESNEVRVLHPGCRYREGDPALSPDGSLVAYGSDESGVAQVFVEPHSERGRKVQVSRDGGREPLWSPDGHWLYYRSGGNVIRVPVEREPRLRVGTPETLFRDIYFSDGNRNWCLSPDGSRFLMIKSRAAVDGGSVCHLDLVENWISEVIHV